MTGGRVVILGATGRNFGAGMSGGIAYIWDPQDNFRSQCNMEMVDLESLEDPAEIADVRSMIERHRHYTGSTVAEQVLADWHAAVATFVKVMPVDYKRVLEQRREEVSAG